MTLWIAFVLPLVFWVGGSSSAATPPALRYHSRLPDLARFFSTNDPQKVNKIPGARAREVNGRLRFRWQFPDEFVRSRIFGFLHRPNTEIRHVERWSNRIIFDAVYTFDQHGRRLNPLPISKQNEFIALFGCSFSYGNGINDNETIPYFLTKKSQKYYAYNYAVGASGPNILLSLLRNRDLQKEMAPKNGKMIYVFNDFHVERVNGFMSAFWMGKTPFFQKVEGEMVRNGNLQEAHPWRWQGQKILRPIFKTLKVTGDFPPLMHQHEIYLCDLVQAAQQEFKKQFRGSDFLVYVHPSNDFSRSSGTLKCFKERGIKTVYSKIVPDDHLVIPEDLHPNARMNELIASEILGVIN